MKADKNGAEQFCAWDLKQVQVVSYFYSHDYVQ